MKMACIVGRRTFLKIAATMGGLAASLGVVRPPAAVEPKGPLPQPGQSSQGYTVTEHIKKYYETASL
ncbi:MAG: formate dehydrogenase [Syntrophobacteraceae bacterium]|jgi:hypothetical protein